MNIIFLDIDGVLNHELWYEQLDKMDISRKDPNLSREDKDIDPSKIKLLNDLCKTTKSKVVISSSWRKLYSVDELKNIFLKKGATFEIIDKTGNCCSGIRGVEISNWIKNIQML